MVKGKKDHELRKYLKLYEADVRLVKNGATNFALCNFSIGWFSLQDEMI